MICELFFWDIEIIRDELISRRGGVNERYWKVSKDGKFRVRDVYRMVWELRCFVEGLNGYRVCWKLIWKIKVLFKI